MTHTLSTVTLALAAAYLCIITSQAVTQQSALLIAFAVHSHEARLTHTYATLESPLALSAQAAVGLRGLPAVTGAQRVQLDVQTVLQAYRFEGEVTRT